MAGFTTALSGNPQGALAAAAQAGRETAGEEYDRALGATTNQVDNPIAPAEEPAEPAETPEAEASAESPEAIENPVEAITEALDPNAPDTSGTAEEKIERLSLIHI